jgi:hypothetical protein
MLNFAPWVSGHVNNMQYLDIALGLLSNKHVFEVPASELHRTSGNLWQTGFVFLNS